MFQKLNVPKAKNLVAVIALVKHKTKQSCGKINVQKGICNCDAFLLLFLHLLLIAAIVNTWNMADVIYSPKRAMRHSVKTSKMERFKFQQ